MFKVKVSAELVIKRFHRYIPSSSHSVRLICDANLKNCFSSRNNLCRLSTIKSVVRSGRIFDVKFNSLPACLWQRRPILSDSTLKKTITLNPEVVQVKDLEHASYNEKSRPNENVESQQAVTDQDVDEELLRYDYENFEELSTDSVESDQIISKNPLPISLERGKTGVFDVEELVALLEDENARDIRVLPVPPEYHYVDYLVVATGRSTRHLRAMAEFIKWMYKRKHSPNDPPSIKIEGEQTKDWFAMDLGNIAVHLFLHETRLHYDLETLWTVGYEADGLDSVSGEATLREDFSFDAELERLRRLKDSRQDSAHGVDEHSGCGG